MSYKGRDFFVQTFTFLSLLSTYYLFIYLFVLLIKVLYLFLLILIFFYVYNACNSSVNLY